MSSSAFVEIPGLALEPATPACFAPSALDGFTLQRKEFPTLSSVGSSTVELAPILLADDDADDLFFSTRLIKLTGTRHPVVSFEDGTAVVDFLLRQRSCQPRERLPRLLFVDLKMPGLGGFSFLEWKAAHSQFRDMDVVVISGSDEMHDVMLAKRLGAQRFLTKRPGVATLARIVHRAYGEPYLYGVQGGDVREEPFYEAHIVSDL